MSNIFTLNQNVIVGIKKLTQADLGSETSHQTHIGLFEGTLSNLPYVRANYYSKLFHNNSVSDCILFLKFINDNRSPAINMGTSKEQSELDNNFVSVGSKIREIADNNRNVNWYLIWFVIENEEIISIIFNQNSNEYNQLTQLGFDLNNIRQNGFQIDLITNQNLYNYLTNYINNQSLDYLQELEIIAQTDEIPVKIIKPRFFDIAKAKLNYALTGRKGEELVAQYLDKLKTENKIIDFNWLNQSRESSFPYDFEINNLNGSHIFSDVKTTSFKFEQGMVFSKSELSFINQNPNYHVYRVFDLKDQNSALRICENITILSTPLVNKISIFEREILMNETKLNSLKLAVSPTNKLLNFNNKIILT